MIDFDSIRETLCEVIRLGIGDDLSQQPDPDNLPNGTIGTIIEARPDKEASVPEYPFAKVDLLQTGDEARYLQTSFIDPQTLEKVYATPTLITYQITVLGEQTLQLSHKLRAFLRRDEVQQIFTRACIVIEDVEPTVSLPEYIDTDFLEQGSFTLVLKVNDVERLPSDENNSYIELVNGEGQLFRHDQDTDPLTLEVSVDANS